MTRSHVTIITCAIARNVASAQSDKIKEQKDDLTMRIPPSPDDPLKSITIHQEIDFTASPQRIYEALLDAKQFTAFSGIPAEINREVGGAFSLFSGHIIGRNLELVPNQRIVQAWRTVDWPQGVYSDCEIRAQSARIRDAFGLRSHRFSGRLARPSGRSARNFAFASNVDIGFGQWLMSAGANE